MNEPELYTCPYCQQSVEVSAPAGEIFTCPGCGNAFSLGRSDDEERGVDAAVNREADARHRRDDELDANRIRQLATMRRAAYRARSYCVIAAFACAVAMVQLVWMTIRHVRVAGWQRRPVGYLLFAIIALAAVTYFVRRAAALHHEARRTALDEPGGSPDFTPLDDGSKRRTNLENVR